MTDTAMPTTTIVEGLENVLKMGSVTQRDRGFATDLLTGQYGYYTRGYLTEKQAEAASRMLHRIANPDHNKRADTIDSSLSSVYEFLLNARQHLKRPKLNLQLDNGMRVRLNLSGVGSSYPDTVNVTVFTGGEYDEDGVWYGRILQSGEWHRRRGVDDQIVEAVRRLFGRLANDAAAVASEYGHLTGNCCFCSHKLSDTRSIEVGFGPVCAKKWGLHEAWKNGDFSMVQQHEHS